MSRDVVGELRAAYEAADLGRLKYDDFGTCIWEMRDGTNSEKAFEVRGWGWLQKLPDGSAKQDARGHLIVAMHRHLPSLLAVAEAARRVGNHTHACARVVNYSPEQACDCGSEALWDALEKLDEPTASQALSALNTDEGGTL